MQPQSPPNQDPAPGLPSQVGTLPGVQPTSAMPSGAQPPVAVSLPTKAAAAVQGSTPAMADDGDLIEKEWVAKVKQVVQSTVQDPYEQNLQFTQLKADYMQKRYGKTIKLD